MSKKPTPLRTEPITAADVLAILTTTHEGDTPDAVLAVVKKLHGKTVNARHLALFPGGAERWSIRREYGMMNLESAGYRKARFGPATTSPDTSDYYSFLLGWSEKNVRWGEPAPNQPERTFENVNPQYFEARVRRNAERAEAAKSAATMAAALEKLRLARLALAEAEAEVNKLTEYGEPYSAVKYELETLVGGA